MPRRPGVTLRQWGRAGSCAASTQGALRIALIIVLLVTGNALLAVIVFLFLIPTVEYIRRQR